MTYNIKADIYTLLPSLCYYNLTIPPTKFAIAYEPLNKKKHTNPTKELTNGANNNTIKIIFKEITLTELQKLLQKAHIKNITELYNSLNVYIQNKISKSNAMSNMGYNLFQHFDQEDNSHVLLLPYYEGLISNPIITFFKYQLL